MKDALADDHHTDGLCLHPLGMGNTRAVVMLQKQESQEAIAGLASGLYLRDVGLLYRLAPLPRKKLRTYFPDQYSQSNAYENRMTAVVRLYLEMCFMIQEPASFPVSRLSASPLLAETDRPWKTEYG